MCRALSWRFIVDHSKMVEAEGLARRPGLAVRERLLRLAALHVRTPSQRLSWWTARPSRLTAHPVVCHGPLEWTTWGHRLPLLASDDGSSRGVVERRQSAR